MPTGNPQFTPGAGERDFASLFEQAWQAHAREIFDLKAEVERLSAECSKAQAAQAQQQVHREPQQWANSLGSARTSHSGQCGSLTEGEGGGGLVAVAGDDDEVFSNGEDSPRALRVEIDTDEQPKRSSRRPSIGSAMQSPGSGEGLRSGLDFTEGRQSAEVQLLQTRGVMYRIVSHHMFEVVFAFLISVNAAIMAAEAQHQGFDIGFQLGHKRFTAPQEERWPHASAMFEVLDWTFGLIFLAEIIVRLAGFRWEFFPDIWNWIDTMIAILWVVKRVGDIVPINTQMLRLFRLVRLLRLIRIMKFMKRQGFDSLYLLWTALKGSGSILFWTLAILSILHMFLALLLSQGLNQFYFYEDWIPAAERLEVFVYFGTFSRALLTMFEITLANWPPACRLLMENVSEWFMLYACAHKLTIGFAVLGVINAVFIQETFKVASLDDNVMIGQRERQASVHFQKMSRLFAEADQSNDGYVDRDEFRTICQDKTVQTWLASMELDAGDHDNLFSMLELNGDEKLSLEELNKGVARLKGTARRIDVLTLMRDHQTLMRDHQRLVEVLTKGSKAVPGA